MEFFSKRPAGTHLFSAFRDTFSGTWFRATAICFMAICLFTCDKAKAQVTIVTPASGTIYAPTDNVPLSVTYTVPLLSGFTSIQYSINSGAQQNFTTSNNSTSASVTLTGLSAGPNVITVTLNSKLLGIGGLPNAPLTATTTVYVVNTAISAYAFSKAITFNPGNLLGIGAALTNFPAYIYIQDDALKSGLNCVNGVKFPNGPNYDLAFTTTGNTSKELPYQVISLDQTNGILQAWVQIPTVGASGNTPLIFYFGAATAPANHTATFYQTTWPTDYQAVYHFEEASATATVADATINGVNGTQTATAVATGKLGSAYSYNGTTSNIKSTLGVNITGSFTLSGWVNVANLQADQKIVTNETGSTGTKLAIAGYLGSPIRAEVESKNALATYTNRTTTGGTTIAANTWYHIQGVYDGANLITYINGVAERSTPAAGPPAASNNSVVIGAEYNGFLTGSFFLNGIIDEVRISNVAKSPDWIKAEYYNQTHTTTCTDYSVGPNVSTASVATSMNGAVSYTWTGAAAGTAATDLTNVSNWSPKLPASSFAFSGPFTLTIPVVTSGKYPVLTVDENINGLTIANGASINLNGHTLTVGCNIYNSAGGQILYGGSAASGITWKGTSAQTYTATGTGTAALAQTGNMTINNAAGVTLNNAPWDVYGILKLSAGNLTIASTGTLNLKSSSTATASVDVIPSGSSVIGSNINVERFMSGGAGKHTYRLLSSPVNTTTIGAVKAYTLQTLQTTTPVTGWGATAPYTASVPSPSAFDGSATGNPSALFYYEPDKDPTANALSVSDYKGLSAITDALPIGNGFLFYFRGDRTATATKFSTTGAPEDTWLKNTGTLNQGDIQVSIPTMPLISYSGNASIKEYAQSAALTTLSTTFSYTSSTPVSSKDGFHLIGNPYAATIDMDKVKSLGLYTHLINDYVVTLDNTGAFNGYLMGSNAVGRLIAPGQGFFIRSDASGATFKFTEACKATSGITAPTTSFDVANNDTTPAIQALRIRLALDSNNANETLIQFGYKNARNTYGANEDLAYMYGPSQTTYLASYTSDNKPCLINQMSTMDSVKKIVLYVQGPSTGRYSLTFSGAETLDPRYKIYLRDSLLNDTLDLSANNKYEFNIDIKNANTYGLQRFSLIISPTHIENQYRLTAFNAVKNANSVELNWKTEAEGDYTNFGVMRSIDGGKTFASIGTMQSSGAGSYGFTDTNPLTTGTNLYKIAQTIDQVKTMSQMVTVSYLTINAQTNKVQVYPNPVASTLNLAVKTDGSTSETGNYKITVTNTNGIVVKSGTSAQGDWSSDVSKLIPGTYFIQVVNRQNNTLAGHTSFVKQ